MKQTRLALLSLAVLLLAGSITSAAATVRGQLVCNGGQSPAVGVAVTLFNQQFGRTTASFTGGDGMYYFNNIPAGQYAVEIWLSKQANVPSFTFVYYVGEPMTDIQRTFLAVCYAQ